MDAQWYTMDRSMTDPKIEWQYRTNQFQTMFIAWLTWWEDPVDFLSVSFGLGGEAGQPREFARFLNI